MMDSRSKGRIGEDVAVQFLINQGFTIVSRNFLRKWGELDIIAKKDAVLHFIEVKSVTRASGGNLSDVHTPEENVHPLKTHKIRRVIETYVTENRISTESEFSFHVLSVFLDMKTRKARVKWIKDIVL